MVYFVSLALTFWVEMNVMVSYINNRKVTRSWYATTFKSSGFR